MMETKIKLGDFTAVWDWGDHRWQSSNSTFANMLNREYRIKAPLPPADPWPPQTAFELAKKIFPKLEIVSMEKPPKYDPNTVY